MSSTRETNRRAFLRRAGQGLLAGLGLTVLSASAAHAAVQCCRDSNCPSCGGGSGSGLHRYRCSSCPSPQCTCIASSNNCVTISTCPS
jgi:hypothetical protein